MRSRVRERLEPLRASGIAQRDLGVLLITLARVLADAWCDGVQQIDGHRSRFVAG